MPAKASFLFDHDEGVKAWAISKAKNQLPAIKLTDKAQLRGAEIHNNNWGHDQLVLGATYYTEAYMLGDGNCFYYAMGTTPEEARALLLANAGQQHVRQLAHAEIVDEFDRLPQKIRRKKSYRALAEEKQLLLGALAINDLGQEERRQLLMRQQNFFANQATWATRRSVYESYVNHVLVDGHWMLFQEDRPGLLKRTYFADVVAHLMNKRLTIWGQVDGNRNRLEQRPEYGQGYIIPLHTYDSGAWQNQDVHLIHRGNHYNRLVREGQARALQEARIDEERHLATKAQQESLILQPEGFYYRYLKQIQDSLDTLLRGDVLSGETRGQVQGWRNALTPARVTQRQVDMLQMDPLDVLAFRTVLLRAYVLALKNQERNEHRSEAQDRELLTLQMKVAALRASLEGAPELPEDKIVLETSRLHQGLINDLDALSREAPVIPGSLNAQRRIHSEFFLNELLKIVELLYGAMKNKTQDDLKWSYLKKCQDSELSHEEKVKKSAHINNFSQIEDYQSVKAVFETYNQLMAGQVKLNTQLLLADPYLPLYNHDISLDPAYREAFPQARWIPFVDEVTNRLVNLCGYEWDGTRELLWDTLDKADTETPLGERTRKRYQRILNICLAEAAAQSDSAQEAERSGYEAFFLFVSQNRGRCVDGLNIAATDFELEHLAHVGTLSEAEKVGLAISRLLEKDRQRFIDQFGELGVDVEEMLYIPAMIRNRLTIPFSLTGAPFDLDNPIVARGWDAMFMPDDVMRIYFQGGILRREKEVDIHGVKQRVVKEVQFEARTPAMIQRLLCDAYGRGDAIRGLTNRPFNNLDPHEQELIRTAERLGYLESMPLSDFAQTQADMINELESAVFILDERDAEFVPQAQRRFFNEGAPLYKDAFFGHVLKKFGWVMDPQIQQDIFWIPSGTERDNFFVQKLTNARQELNSLTMAEFEMPADFDPWHYLYLHNDVMAVAKTTNDPVQFACWHYKNHGGARGERFYKTKLPKGFSAKSYCLLNMDLSDFVEKMPKESMKGFLEVHYAKHGVNEGRQYFLPDGFDALTYMWLHPDLQAYSYRNNKTLRETICTLACHYQSSGQMENRAIERREDLVGKPYLGNVLSTVLPTDFHPLKYLMLHEDLQKAYEHLPYQTALKTAREHFIAQGIKEHRLY